MTAPRFPVEPGHVLMFARAVGDTSDAYSDATFARGGFTETVPPPTFVQSSSQFVPDYPLRPQPGQRWFGSGTLPVAESAPQAGGGVLHAEQRFEFHRAVRTGDTFSVRQREGKSWEKQGRKGGRLLFNEVITEYFDQDGLLVVTSTAVAVATQTIPGERGQG